jgi:hypothetical protein
VEKSCWNKIDHLGGVIVIKWQETERKTHFTDGFGRKFYRIL